MWGSEETWAWKTPKGSNLQQKIHLRSLSCPNSWGCFRWGLLQCNFAIISPWKILKKLGHSPWKMAMKNDGWKMILSCWNGKISGVMLKTSREFYSQDKSRQFSEKTAGSPEASSPLPPSRPVEATLEFVLEHIWVRRGVMICFLWMSLISIIGIVAAPWNANWKQQQEDCKLAQIYQRTLPFHMWMVPCSRSWILPLNPWWILSRNSVGKMELIHKWCEAHLPLWQVHLAKDELSCCHLGTKTWLNSHAKNPNHKWITDQEPT